MQDKLSILQALLARVQHRAQAPREVSRLSPADERSPLTLAMQSVLPSLPVREPELELAPLSAAPASVAYPAPPASVTHPAPPASVVHSAPPASGTQVTPPSVRPPAPSSPDGLPLLGESDLIGEILASESDEAPTSAPRLRESLLDEGEIVLDSGLDEASEREETSTPPASGPQEVAAAFAADKAEGDEEDDGMDISVDLTESPPPSPIVPHVPSAAVPAATHDEFAAASAGPDSEPVLDLISEPGLDLDAAEAPSTPSSLEVPPERHSDVRAARGAVDPSWPPPAPEPVLEPALAPAPEPVFAPRAPEPVFAPAALAPREAEVALAPAEVASEPPLAIEPAALAIEEPPTLTTISPLASEPAVHVASTFEPEPSVELPPVELLAVEPPPLDFVPPPEPVFQSPPAEPVFQPPPVEPVFQPPPVEPVFQPPPVEPELVALAVEPVAPVLEPPLVEAFPVVPSVELGALELPPIEPPRLDQEPAPWSASVSPATPFVPAASANAAPSTPPAVRIMAQALADPGAPAAPFEVWASTHASGPIHADAVHFVGRNANFAPQSFGELLSASLALGQDAHETQEVP